MSTAGRVLCACSCVTLCPPDHPDMCIHMGVALLEACVSWKDEWLKLCLCKSVEWLHGTSDLGKHAQCCSCVISYKGLVMG
jgi:hypothetical protein